MITTRQAAKPAPVQDERRDAIRSLYLESLQLVERLQVPVLLVHGTDDMQVRADHSSSY